MESSLGTTSATTSAPQPITTTSINTTTITKTTEVKVVEHQQQQQLQNQQPKQQQQHPSPIDTYKSDTKNGINNHTLKKCVGVHDLEKFFQNGLYNSCKATDDLIKAIEEAHDEVLARRALELYQKHYSTLERPWDHVNFTYGLGLIYMHFNAYNWAIKSFREAIYVQPSFARSRDVHTRLGLIFKATGRYKLSEKHFNLAINDTRPNSGLSSKLELRFHLAHLYEIQGKFKQATEAYEKLLKEEDLPAKLSANIHKQLGWIYYSTGSSDPSTAFYQQQRQLQQRNASRNFTRDDDVKFNLPSSFDPHKMDTALNCLNTSLKSDNDSGTSYYLGRCLTNIGKFQDAFASYRSVIDKEESTADTWCSIGVLYHRQNQPWDAQQAYIRSVQFDKKHAVAWMNLGILYESHNQFKDALKCYQHVLRSQANEVDKSLQTRIKFIQKQLIEIEVSASNNETKPNIVSDKLLSLEDLWNLESETNSSTSNTSLTRTTEMISSTATNQSIKNTNRGQYQQRAAPMDSGVNKQQQPQVELRGNGLTDRDHKADPSFIASTATKINETSITTTKLIFSNESLDTDSKSRLPRDPIHDVEKHNGVTNDCELEICTQQNNNIKQQPPESKDICFNQVLLTNGASKDSGISSDGSTYTDYALVPSQNIDSVSAACYISADQVIGACRNLPKPKKIDVNMLSDEDRPPNLFPKPPPYPPLPPDKLFPSPPSIFLESKKDLTSKRLQEFCQSSPISIVRNIATVLKLDLGLFSTKTLVESNPDQKIDVVSHLHHQNSEGINEDVVNFWSCERHISPSTIVSYANYQVASFRESLQEERDNKSRPNLSKDFETDSNESASQNAKKSSNFGQSSSRNSECSSSMPQSKQTGPVNKKMKKDSPRAKYVRSADKIDLSDEKKWRPQLNELNKLPHYFKCVSASNMLTHIGSAIPEVNTILMRMHVPGCRVVGNRTPNNFCPVNINIGPGDYEWCAISSEYQRTLTKLCNRNGFEIDNLNWWPRLDDLQKYNVPVYRFSQRPGDLVWVNSGTFYWVQAVGWSNGIQWNVGPLCAQQYRLASTSFEINKLLVRKSDVPLVQMTWNIVININIIADDELFRSIVDVLRRSIRYCVLIYDLVEQQSKQQIVQLDNEPGPRCAKFCSLCESEVFNITFVKKESLYCAECARRLDETLISFNVEQEYELSYLTKLYDNFIDTKKKFQAKQHQNGLRQQQQQPHPHQHQQQDQTHAAQAKI